MSSKSVYQVEKVTEWVNAFILIGRCYSASFEVEQDKFVLAIEDSLLNLRWNRSPNIVKTLAYLAGTFDCIPIERKSEYLYEAALKLNDPKSQYFLALELRHGVIYPRDDQQLSDPKHSYDSKVWFQAESKLWMETAAQNGSLDAKLELGLALIHSDEDSDRAKATKWLHEVVIDTNKEKQKELELVDLAEAKYMLAYQMELGLASSLPLKELFLLYEEAAKSGVPEAMLAVGHYLENGVGVIEDIEEAIDWYLKAAGEDYGLDVGFLLAWRLSNNPEHRKLAAEKKHVEAMLSLGEEFLAQNYYDYSYFESGVDWLEACSEKGCLQATLILAKTFDRSGEYRIPDEWNLYFSEYDRLEIAVAHYERAFELGFESAVQEIERIQAQIDAC
jgi:TPR repeat protein